MAERLGIYEILPENVKVHPDTTEALLVLEGMISIPDIAPPTLIRKSEN